MSLTLAILVILIFSAIASQFGSNFVPCKWSLLGSGDQKSMRSSGGDKFLQTIASRHYRVH